MDKLLILQPVVALFLLTAAVWAFMYGRRLYFMFGHDIDPQSVSTPELINERIPASVNNSSNNLKNLFEVPVVFYALCVLLLISGRVDAVYLYAAWAYFGLRTLHSLIHCTVNVVRIRFAFYFLSSLILWFAVVRFAVTVF